MAVMAGLTLGGTVALAQAPAGSSPNKNLLVNGAFEKGMEGWTVDAAQKKGTATIDQKELRGGKPTLRMDNLEPDSVNVKQTIKVEPNTRYRFEGYIKTKDVEPAKRDGKAGACLAIIGGDEKSQIIGKTKAWTKVTLEYLTGPAQTEVSLCTRLGFHQAANKGTAWFSDLAVERVGKAPPPR